MKGNSFWKPDLVSILLTCTHTCTCKIHVCVDCNCLCIDNKINYEVFQQSLLLI